MQSRRGFESAQWYSIAEASPALVRLCDAQGAALYFNRRRLEFTGVDSSRQLGRGWLALVHGQDVDAAPWAAHRPAYFASQRPLRATNR